MNDWIRFSDRHPSEFEWVEVSSDDDVFIAFYTMDPYGGPTWNTAGDATEGGQAARPNDFWRSRQTSFEVAEMNLSTIKNDCPIIGRKCIVNRDNMIFRAYLDYDDDGDLAWIANDDTVAKCSLVQSTDLWRYC